MVLGVIIYIIIVIIPIIIIIDLLKFRVILHCSAITTYSKVFLLHYYYRKQDVEIWKMIEFKQP